jgi:flavin reductase (DIM6/NTAB) family NADH-FMN oxidoreductase RutF
MNLPKIPIEEFTNKPYTHWEQQWLVLTAGDFVSEKFNCMTVAWGAFGVMWGLPCATVVVRPVRYTYQFIEKYSTFTLCAFPSQYHKALNVIGSRSGRNTNKIDAAKITPTAVDGIAAPAYAEAELIVACRKLYWSDLEPAHFLDPVIEKHYPQKDYHRMYFGEILSVWGTDTYRS